ncbi:MULTISPECIES: hypothetical protein [unclassified Nitrospina]|uniref:hypothetical protein n=1 Tax=unclassified Nitrospina TaxID=2638683 RepID=UPI003F944B26
MSFEPPPGWSKDFLTKFLGDTHNNSYYVFHHHKEIFQLFSESCEIFEVVEGCISKPSSYEELVPALFFNMARSSYYSSIKILVGGQLPETYALLRQCIENSLVGFYFFVEIQNNEEDGIEKFKFWLSRHESEENRKKIRNTFTLGSLKNRLKEQDGELGEIVSRLYEITIDSGAHPNELALLSGLRFSVNEQIGMIHQTFVIDFEKQWVHFLNCAKILLEVGIASLNIFQLTSEHNFEISGIANRIKGFKGKYGKILKRHQN